MTQSPETADTGLDPCTQIQADLSAMLDNELDSSSVRRVMFHLDTCPCCKAFFDGIRVQALSHRQLHAVLTGSDDQMIEVPRQGGGTVQISVAELRRQLTANRDQLARILYELGRGYVLMGISPVTFSRVITKEPMPIPDAFQRGRNLIDEVERIAGGNPAGSEWSRAKELLGGGWADSPDACLAKGCDLLREALLLEPLHFDARIYLGHALHVLDAVDQACQHFLAVLDRAPDVKTRGFALFSLGNAYLDASRYQDAADCFLKLVESGAVPTSPQFGLSYFNLALAYGFQGHFDECRRWLERLDIEMPHKRRMIAQELVGRTAFVASLSRDPQVYRSLADRFPSWFPNEAC